MVQNYLRQVNLCKQQGRCTQQGWGCQARVLITQQVGSCSVGAGSVVFIRLASKLWHRPFYLKWVSCGQCMYGCCFLLHPVTLSLLIGTLNPFAFKVIIGRCVVIAILLLIFLFFFPYLLREVPLILLLILIWW